MAAMTSVAARLRAQLERDGAMPFARFMAAALYGADGYYARERVAIGEAGDYVTGSSFSPLFGRATARLLQRLARELGGRAQLLEAGYGNGTHLAAVAGALAGEAGFDLFGWDRVSRPLPSELRRVREPEDVAPIDGLVFSYELFDALPVNRLIGRAQNRPPGELWVELDARQCFAWSERELSDPALLELLPRRGAELAAGQVADLSLDWAPLYGRLARCLRRGLLVTCDYGFETERLLDPRIRFHGTLACYRRQRVHRDPFAAVGEQDLTAHVDLSALRRAGEAAGLVTVASTRQAPWLVACGLFEDLAETGLEARQQAMALLDLEGMGEEIRVLVQARDLAADRVLPLDVLNAV